MRDAVNDIVFERPHDADTLRRLRSELEIYVASRVTAPYAMLELNDVMHWKKRAQP